MRCDAALLLQQREPAQRKGSSFYAATLAEGTSHSNEFKHNIRRQRCLICLLQISSDSHNHVLLKPKFLKMRPLCIQPRIAQKLMLPLMIRYMCEIDHRVNRAII